MRFDLEEIIEWVKHSKPQRNLDTYVIRTRNLDIDNIVKKAIEGVKGKGYNPTKRETSLNQGLRKEVSDESV